MDCPAATSCEVSWIYYWLNKQTWPPAVLPESAKKAFSPSNRFKPHWFSSVRSSASKKCGIQDRIEVVL